MHSIATWKEILETGGPESLLSFMKATPLSNFKKPDNDDCDIGKVILKTNYMPLIDYYIDSVRMEYRTAFESWVRFAVQMQRLDLLQYFRMKNIPVNRKLIFCPQLVGNCDIITDILENEWKDKLQDEELENHLVMAAASNASLDFVHYLYNKGIFRLDVLKRTCVKFIVTQPLACQKNLSILKFVVDEVGFSERNQHIFLTAIEYGYIDNVRFLLPRVERTSKHDLDALICACIYNFPFILQLLISNGFDPNQLSDRTIRSCDWTRKYEILWILYNHGVFCLSILCPKAKKYIEIRKRSEHRAATKIYFWWIPICYDLNRECGKRMMNRTLDNIEAMQCDFFK